MGVPGLWEYLKSADTADERAPLRIIANDYLRTHGRPLRLGIDAYMWIFELTQQQSRDVILSEEEVINRLIMGFHSRVRDLISLHISFVFVFDGKYKSNKTRWDKDPMASMAQAENNYDFYEDYKSISDEIKQNTIAHRSQEYMSDSLPETRVVQELLLKWNIQFVQSPGEAEAELGRMNASYVLDAILTNDSDSFMYGAQCVFKNFSKWYDDYPASSANRLIKPENDWYVTPFRMSKITEITGLTRERMLFVGCLSGNDFHKGATSLGIKRCIQLAIVGTKQFKGNEKSKYTPPDPNLDFVKMLTDIYIPSDKISHLEGNVAHTVDNRRILLRQLGCLLQEEINLHANYYFGRRADTLELTLPDDCYFMIHFFPIFAPFMFHWIYYDTNNANSREAILTPTEHVSDYRIIANLPQRSSLNFNVELNCFEAYTLDVVYKYRKLFVELNADGEFVLNRFYDQLRKGAEGVAKEWFTKPSFEWMIEHGITTRRSGIAFLADNMTESYLVRILLAMEEQEAIENFTVVGSKVAIIPHFRRGTSSIDDPRKRWNDVQYHLKFSPRSLFSKYFLDYQRIQDTNNEKSYNDYIKEINSETELDNKTVWISKILLEISDSGIRLIKEYEDKQIEKAKIAKLPKSLKFTQKSTLDSMNFTKLSKGGSPEKAPSSIPIDEDDFEVPYFTPHNTSPVKTKQPIDLLSGIDQVGTTEWENPLVSINDSPTKRRRSHSNSSSSPSSSDVQIVHVEETNVTRSVKPIEDVLLELEYDDSDDQEEYGNMSLGVDKTVFFTPSKERTVDIGSSAGRRLKFEESPIKSPPERKSPVKLTPLFLPPDWPSNLDQEEEKEETTLPVSKVAPINPIISGKPVVTNLVGSPVKASKNSSIQKSPRKKKKGLEIQKDQKTLDFFFQKGPLFAKEKLSKEIELADKEVEDIFTVSSSQKSMNDDLIMRKTQISNTVDVDKESNNSEGSHTDKEEYFEVFDKVNETREDGAGFDSMRFDNAHLSNLKLMQVGVSLPTVEIIDLESRSVSAAPISMRAHKAASNSKEQMNYSEGDEDARNDALSSESDSDVIEKLMRNALEP